MKGENNLNINTDKIMDLLKEAKHKLNKLEGHVLAKKDVFSSELYMMLLCCTASVSGKVEKMKLNFLSTILKASGLKDSIETYFDKADQLNLDTLKEFVSKMLQGNLQYNFILDSLILSNLNGNIGEKESEFIGELAEALKIEKEEMEFLCDLTICILKQNNKSFNEMLNRVPNKLIISEFRPYLLDFIDGFPYEEEYITGEVHLTGKHIINKPIINEGTLYIENAVITFRSEGKITSREGSEVHIKTSEIIDGEFIFEEKAKLSAIDSLFRDNHNKRVFTLQQCKRQNFIENCTFKNCQLDDNGAAIYILESVLEMSKNTFLNCKSNKKGGAIYIDGEIDRVIYWSNLKFSHCEGERGGAVCQNSYNMYYFVSESIFNDCKASKSGAAIYIRNENYEYDALITRCEFNNCSAKYVGTIFLYYGYADRNIIGCRFNKCISTDNYISGIGIFNRSNNFGNDNIFSECVNPIGNVTDNSYF